jgi:hypothetical protein
MGLIHGAVDWWQRTIYGEQDQREQSKYEMMAHI